jgi:predicted Fe-Mo cluster-binding NifX family protein
MKLVVTATSDNLESAIDSRFGRAGYFVVVDVDTLEWQAYPNPAVGASGGAGTQAAQFIANQGVQAAVSGDFGPNAYNILNAAHIDMYLLGASQTVRDAVEHFKAGQLAPAAAATSAGHRHH